MFGQLLPDRVPLRRQQQWIVGFVRLARLVPTIPHSGDLYGPTVVPNCLGGVPGAKPLSYPAGMDMTYAPVTSPITPAYNGGASATAAESCRAQRPPSHVECDGPKSHRLPERRDCRRRSCAAPMVFCRFVISIRYQLGYELFWTLGYLSTMDALDPPEGSGCLPSGNPTRS